MQAIITNRIRLTDAGTGELAAMATRLTLPNPAYQEALRMGRWTGNIEPTMCLFEQDDDDMVVPWGLKFSLPPGTIIDDHTETHPARFEWMGPELRDYQERAVQAALEAGGGVVQAPTGSGKNFLALNLIARLGQKTLVLVRNKDLAEQWLTEIRRVLGIEAGLIGAGKRTDGEIVVGLVQTVSTQSLGGFGCVVLDEAHNAPARQAFDLLNRTTARYRLGLTATPQRRDGLEPMLFAALGPVVAEIREEDVGRKGVLPVTVVTREMPYCGGQVDSWAKLCSALAADPARNRMIVDSALKVASTAPVVVLTATIEHAELLGEMIDGALVVHGQLPAKVRRERMQQAQSTNILIGTLSLLSEGLDIPPLTYLIMAAPVSASAERETPAATRLIQSIGRCRRPFPGKARAYVLDIHDQHPMARSAARKRLAVYANKGFHVEQR